MLPDILSQTVPYVNEKSQRCTVLLYPPRNAFATLSMDTPWGPLSTLDPADRALALTILSHDKHQLIEGLVVENTFDQIIKPLTDGSAPSLIKLDVETTIVGAPRTSKRWLALVWARSLTTTTGLRRYLDALWKVATPYVVEYISGTFIAREWMGGRRATESTPLQDLLAHLSGKKPVLPVVDLTVRDPDRQRVAFWGFLTETYPGPRLWNEVVLTRLFINFGIQPFFRGVWNLDRICLFNDDLWLLEVKHKYPFGRSELQFGINDGELQLMKLVGDAGIRTLYSLIVKPKWSKDVGSMYLHTNMDMRQRAAVVGMTPSMSSIELIQRGQTALSPSHTSITGRDSLKYKSIPARAFTYLGSYADGPQRLSAQLADLMNGKIGQPVSDGLLRQLRTDV